jgi:hypothetical protein
MIKDNSAVSDPERRYAFRQAVGRGNAAAQWRAADCAPFEKEEIGASTEAAKL